MFHHMDSLVLENICDRVRSLIFTKGEMVSTAKYSFLCFNMIYTVTYINSDNEGRRSSAKNDIHSKRTSPEQPNAT